MNEHQPQDTCTVAASIAQRAAAENRLPHSQVQDAIVTAIGVAAAIEATKAEKTR